MNQNERTELKRIHDDLIDIAGRAPKRTTYNKGRAESSISLAVIEVARRIDALLPEPEDQPEPA